jgi:hypothetical protein
MRDKCLGTKHRFCLFVRLFVSFRFSVVFGTSSGSRQVQSFLFAESRSDNLQTAEKIKIIASKKKWKIIFQKNVGKCLTQN